MTRPSKRDPRRSLAIGTLIAVCVLAVLAAIVAFGIYETFSVRQDKSGFGGSRFGSCQVAALDCRHA